MILTFLLIILILVFVFIAFRANRRKDLEFLVISGLAALGLFFTLLWHLFAR